MRNKYYFYSYNYVSNIHNGFGSNFVSLNGLFDPYFISEELKKAFDFESVVILNFQEITEEHYKLLQEEYANNN